MSHTITPLGKFNQSVNIDAYSDWIRDGQYRMRVAQFDNVADLRFTNQFAKDQLWVTQTTGNGTITDDATNSSRVLGITPGAAGTATVQSSVRFGSVPPYPIVGWFCVKDFAGNIFEPTYDITKRLGIYDDDMGFYVESQPAPDLPRLRIFDNTLGINIFIDQADWDDPMDGTGESGETLNQEIQQYFVEYSWGGGYARFGVVVEGIPYIIHTEYFGNRKFEVMFGRPSLPVRAELIGGGVYALPAVATLSIYYVTLQQDRGAASGNIIRSVDRGRNTEISVDANYHSIIGLRLKNGTKEPFVKLKKFSLICSTGGNIHYVLVLNPTQSLVPTWVGLDDSPIEYSLGTAANEYTYDVKNVIASGYFSNNTDEALDDIVDSLILLGSEIDGSPKNEIHLLAANGTAGGGENVIGAIQIIQQF